MIQTGIFTGYFPYGLEETARRIRALDFNTVQLDVSFKDLDLSTEAIDRSKCRKIRDTFRRHHLPVCCISGYTNLVHPDPERRKANLEHLKTIIRFARDLGSPYVVSETGTFNPDSDWVHHPRNKTEEGYQECCEVIGELVRLARDHGVRFLIETYVNNVIGSVAETLRLFADINDPCLGLLMDPTNYFETHNIDRMDSTLNHVFDALSDRVVIAHAKDVKPAEPAGPGNGEAGAGNVAGERSGAGMRAGSGTDAFMGSAAGPSAANAAGPGVRMADIDADEAHALRGVGAIELPAPGLGILNYRLYLERLGRGHPNIPLVIEHLDEPDIPRAKRFLEEQLLAAGR